MNPSEEQNQKRRAKRMNNTYNKKDNGGSIAEDNGSSRKKPRKAVTPARTSSPRRNTTGGEENRSTMRSQQDNETKLKLAKAEACHFRKELEKAQKENLELKLELSLKMADAKACYLQEEYEKVLKEKEDLEWKLLLATSGTDEKSVTVGSRIAVYWPKEDQEFEGEVTEIRGSDLKKEYYVIYDDGDEGWHSLDKDHWRLASAKGKKAKGK